MANFFLGHGKWVSNKHTHTWKRACITDSFAKIWIGLHAFFYKQRFFSTQPQRCLTLSWIKLRMLLRCCLIHKSIIILRHSLYLLYFCTFLDLVLFMSDLCDLFFIFIVIFTMINHIISWIQTLSLLLIFENMSY